MSPAIENFGKLSVVSSRRTLFTNNALFWNNNNKTISNNEELEETFNKHFSKLVENVDIDKTLASNIASSDITDLDFKAIKKYDDHPIIK